VQEREPVHARHLDVEHEHVGPLAPHLLHRVDRVHRGGDRHPGLPQDLLERDADDRGVVDDEHPGRHGHRLASRSGA
jgi:hypothetical protein